ENGDAGRPKSPEYIAETTVAPDFFSVLRLPLLEGASFTEGAAKREDVIINASLAKIFWPGQRAVGKHIRFVAPPGIKPSDWSTVVAVVANSTVEGLGTDRDQPMLYIP